jgi:hypothetical protein
MPGKRGNTNALKHGLYSKHISVIDEAGLQPMKTDQNLDELALCRVMLAQVLDKRADAMTEKSFLKWDAAAGAWIERISSLIHNNAILGRDSRTAFVTIMDYIRTANDEQKIVK